MTLHVLVVDPPRPGLALPELVAADPASPEPRGLAAADAATLAGAMLQDAAVAVQESGGDLLVNHPTAAQLPEAHRTDVDPDTELRALLGETELRADDIRFEPQVGSAFDARVGNTVTHLLREEGHETVAVLDGRVPTLDRTVLDSAAMKLRRSEVVVSPAPAGGLGYLGVTEAIDFAGAWQPPAIQTVVDRAVEADLAVDFLPIHPRVDGRAGLASLVTVVAARRTAGRRVPTHTTAAIEALGLEVSGEGDDVSVRVEPTDRA